MRTAFADRSLEGQIAQWRASVSRRRVLHGPDVEELEGRLRDHLVALTGAGLAGDEAFLVAVKRMGSLEPANAGRAETSVALGLAVAAALAVKVPALFGLRIDTGEESFYLRNASLFVFPLLAAYFVWKRGWGVAGGLRLALPFAAGAVFANVFPFPRGNSGCCSSDTEALAILHLPIALWMAVGFAYVRGRWFDDGGRMNFVRFSGELAIYYVLIALGGGVLTAFTFMMFEAIKMNPEWFVGGWLIPCGAAGAVIVAVAEHDGAVHNPDGFDVAALIGHRASTGSIRDFAGATFIADSPRNSPTTRRWRAPKGARPPRACRPRCARSRRAAPPPLRVRRHLQVASVAAVDLSLVPRQDRSDLESARAADGPSARDGLLRLWRLSVRPSVVRWCALRPLRPCRRCIAVR